MEFSVPNPHIVLGEPPLVSTNTVAVGDSTFGRYSFTDHHFAVAGAFLTPVSAADGEGVFSWPNGDQLFVSFSGLYRAQTSPGIFPVDGFYTFTGGRGRFAGASGSGTFTAVVTSNTNFVTRVYEGTVSAPKQ